MKNLFTDSERDDSPLSNEPEQPFPPVKKRTGFTFRWPHLFILCLAAGLLIAWQAEKGQSRWERLHAHEEATDVAALLKLHLERAMASVLSIETMVLQSGTNTFSLQTAGPRLLAIHPGVVSVALLPQGILSDMHPRPADRSAYGKNLFADASTLEVARAMMNSGQMGVLGPFDAGGGSSELAVYKPVFVRNTAGASSFWGFVSCRIRVGSVLQASGFRQLEHQDYEAALVISNERRSGYSLVASIGSPPSSELVRVPISLAGRQWVLGIRPEGGWWSSARFAGNAFVALVFAALAAGLMRSSEKTRFATRHFKEANEQAERNNERVRAIIESSQDALVITDERGTITTVNARAERLFGYSRDELLGKPVEMLMPERFRAEHPTHRKRFLASPSMRAMGSGLELKALHRKGREFPVDISLTSLHDERGDLLICSSIRDLTELHELRKSAQQVEERFEAVAGHSMAWETWVDASGQPAWISPGVERITGYTPDECHAMEEFPLPLAAEEYREEVRGWMLEAAGGGTGDGREFPIRHQDGKRLWIALSWRPVSHRKHGPAGHLLHFRDITGRKQLEEALKHNRNQLQSILDQVQASIHVKDTQGRYLFLNRGCEQLINCSRDAVVGRRADEIGASDLPTLQEEWDNEVRVGGKAIEKEEELVLEGRKRSFVLRVFPLKDEWDRIFATAGILTETSREKQLQSDASAAQKEIERLNNLLQKGQSTTSAASPAPAQNRESPLPASIPKKTSPKPTEKPVQNRIVLVVDDDASSRSALCSILQSADMEADQAVNGLDAVEKIRCREYDAVLMDVEMPALDGLQASRRIRSERAGKPLPIIAITSNNTAEDRIRCLEAGMDDHLSKPIDRKILLERLDHWMKAEERVKALGTTPGPEAATSQSDDPIPPPDKSGDRKSKPQKKNPPARSASSPSDSKSHPSKSESKSPPASGSSGDRASVPNKADESTEVYGLDLDDVQLRLEQTRSEIGGLLVEFAVNSRETLAELERAIETGSLETARRHAHSIAGGAGNFSADTLHRLARTLELALKFEHGGYTAMFQELQDEATRVFKSIDQTFSSSRESTGSGDTEFRMAEIGAKKLARYLEQLETKLSENDLEGVAQAALQLETISMSSDQRKQFEGVQELVDKFDYQEAAAAVRQMISRLGSA